MAIVPRKNWHEWRFGTVPAGFWDSAENRHRYLRWLGRELGFRKPQDWYRITRDDIIYRRSAPLFDNRFPSLCDLMRDFLPELNWDHLDKRYSLTERQL